MSSALSCDVVGCDEAVKWQCLPSNPALVEEYLCQRHYEEMSRRSPHLAYSFTAADDAPEEEPLEQQRQQPP